MALGSTSIAALTREGLRNLIQTSLFGRRSGLDRNDYQVGAQDTRLPVDLIGTTVPTSLAPNGASVLACTAVSSAAHTLQNPVPGIYKEITQISSSTLGIAVSVGASGQIVTTNGSSFNNMVFAGVGAAAELFCLSTNGSGIWSAAAYNSSVTFSTI